MPPPPSLQSDPDLYNAFTFFVGRVLAHPEAELRHVIGVFWCSAKSKYPQAAMLQQAVESRVLQLAFQFSPQAIANLLFSYGVLDLRPSVQVLQVVMMQLRAHAPRFEPQATINTLQAFSRLSLHTEFRETARLLQARVVDHCRTGAITVQAAASLLAAYAGARFMPSDPECDSIMALLQARSDEFDAHSTVACLSSLAKLQAVKQFDVSTV